MALVLDKVSEDTFYENILLGLTKVLEKHPRITNIELERQQPCGPAEITLFEQHHGVKLPEDMKEFYLSTNGFKLIWDYTFSEQETLPLGLINVNSLSKLISLTGYKIYSAAEIIILQDKYHLHLNSESKVFQLSYVDDISQVCLIYISPRSVPTIWLADADANWHFLTRSFTKYLCMSVFHLGLPLWQFCFTCNGVPSWVEQVFMMTAPHLPIAEPIKFQSQNNDTEDKIDLQNYYINKLDLNIFKSKTRIAHKSTTDLLKYRKKH